jgi:hypothetical protein
MLVVSPKAIEKNENKQQKATQKEAISFNDRVKAFDGEIYQDPKTGLTIVVKEPCRKIGEEFETLRDPLFVKNPVSKLANQIIIKWREAQNNDSMVYVISTNSGDASIAVAGDRCAVADSKGNVTILTRVKDSEKLRLENQLQYGQAPDIHKADYLAKLADGRKICITSSKSIDKDDDHSFRAFFGKDKLEEIKITNIRKWKDGGTTEIYTEKGMFFFPFVKEKPGHYRPNGRSEEIELNLVDKSLRQQEAEKLGVLHSSKKEVSIELNASKFSIKLSDITIHHSVSDDIKKGLQESIAYIALIQPITSLKELGGILRPDDNLKVASGWG